MYKEDVALNNLQWLIPNQTKQNLNQTKPCQVRKTPKWAK